MRAIQRFGMLALCVLIFSIALFRAPESAAGPAAEAARAGDVAASRGEVSAPKPELIVSIGRLRWAWPEDALPLLSRVQRAAEVLCLSASALRVVDAIACRHELTAALQDTRRYITASLSLLESRQ